MEKIIKLKTNKRKKKNVSKNLKPVIFKNSPISSEKDDLFSFYMQAETLKTVIKNNANIIGIIGDYGTGKSSLTEILKKKLFFLKFKKTISINLWDSLEVEKKEGVEKNDTNKTNIGISTKSFLYQLAFGNKKRNRNFAKYINHRLSKNYGKLSLSISNYYSLIVLVCSGLFFIFYLFLTGLSGSEFTRKFYESLKNPIWNDIFINKYLSIIKVFVFPPLVLFIALCLLVIGLMKGNFIFSLWDSQGKVEPDSSDVFEIYREIADRLCSPCIIKRKQIIFVEDLDRINNPEITSLFLKELYRFVNLIPEKQKKRIVYIVSLKSEESLKRGISEVLYSKIFDYTLNIKPIHNENLSEVLLTILENNRDALFNFERSSKLSVREIIQKKYLKNLYWIQKGEELTIREIKDRLNDSFMLFNSLMQRNTDADIQLNKCAAASYLQRKYPLIWSELLKKENELVQFIFSSYLLETQAAIIATIKESKLISMIKIILANSEDLELFLEDFCFMIFRKDIDDDFMMYFYNYPINSYIMNISERMITNYLLHFEESLYIEDKKKEIEDSLKKIAEKRKHGHCVENALKRLVDFNLPFSPIILEFEYIFNIACNKKFKKKLHVLLVDCITMKGSDITQDLNLLNKVVNFNVDNVDERNEILGLFSENLVAAISDSNINASQLREKIIMAVENHEFLFTSLYFKPGVVPLISSDEIKSIKNKQVVLDFLDIEKITPENFIETFLACLNLSFNDAQVKKFEKILTNIPNVLSLPDANSMVLSFMTKYKLVNHDYIKFIIKAVSDEEIKCNFIYEYLLVIDMSEMTDEEFLLLDLLLLDCIEDEKILEKFEFRNLFRSSLISRENNNLLNIFKFDEEAFIPEFLLIAKELFRHNETVFLNIRSFILFNLRDNPASIKQIYHDSYPLITSEELKTGSLLQDDIYQFVDQSRIVVANYSLLSSFINDQILEGNALYSFFTNFFEPKEKECFYIHDADVQKVIINNIDFQKIDMSTLSNDQIKNVCTYFETTFNLTTLVGAIDFMDTIKILVPSLEEIVCSEFNNSELHPSYIDLINIIKNPTETTLKIICENNLNSKLDKEITDILFQEKCFVPYLIGTILRESLFNYPNEIPLPEQYKVFIENDACSEIMAQNIVFLTDIINHELIYNEAFPLSRVKFLSKVEQNIKLVKFVFSKFDSDLEKKKYLIESDSFLTKKDSDEFSKFITKPDNVKFFKDDYEFYKKIWYKLWRETNKSGFTAKINRELGSHYSKPSEY